MRWSDEIKLSGESSQSFGVFCVLVEPTHVRACLPARTRERTFRRWSALRRAHIANQPALLHRSILTGATERVSAGDPCLSLAAPLDVCAQGDSLRSQLSPGFPSPLNLQCWLGAAPCPTPWLFLGDGSFRVYLRQLWKVALCHGPTAQTLRYFFYLFLLLRLMRELFQNEGRWITRCVKRAPQVDWAVQGDTEGVVLRRTWGLDRWANMGKCERKKGLNHFWKYSSLMLWRNPQI